jgi:EAL domain-containing protein (putative c-di-GMP-specific phosphodiesterase class I)
VSGIFDYEGTGDIVGVEAWVRWPHPERGLLEPDHFLPLVRQNGLRRAVTEVVLAQALGDAAQWHTRGVGIPVAVNLFAPSLGDLELPSRIAHALADRELTSDALDACAAGGRRAPLMPRPFSARGHRAR